MDRKYRGQKKKKRQEQFEDTKGVIRGRKSKMDRKYNDQKKRNTEI